ncbi:MAG: metalloregulator ArsR/SmtB family transcription factor [Rhizobium sp.]
MQRVFHALASPPRREILGHLALSGLTAGEIAARFNMAKPSVSQHLAILENAALITKKKRGQYVHYALAPNNLADTLSGFIKQVCPVERTEKKEGRTKAKAADAEQMTMFLDVGDQAVPD